jgi:hypothetical protein
MDWVAGKLTIEQVQGKLGKLSLSSIGSNVTYYYEEDGLGASFTLDRERAIDVRGRGRRFEVEPVSWKSASIPREAIEQRLGLHRVQLGELVDGVRKETLVYEVRPMLGMQDPDEVSFNLRLPLPDDSPFDVRATLVYRANPEEPGQSELDTTTYFRSIEIRRVYLTPEELEERNFAKRKQYGYMNLRTGMLCPESGWWEGWTAQNHIDKQVIRQGQLFPQASLGPNRTAPDGAWIVDAQWMWHGPYEEQRDS